jgi:hypothetical protein
MVPAGKASVAEYLDHRQTFPSYKYLPLLPQQVKGKVKACRREFKMRLVGGNKMRLA